MNKWIKRIGIACLIPIALVSLLSIALYIPSLQDLAVRKATAYAERATGMRIGIGQIRLHFPLDLTIRQVEVMRPPADTLLNLRSLTIRLRALPLLHQQVSVEMIDQNPIGKSSRSNPVTYIKAYDEIRKLYSDQPYAKTKIAVLHLIQQNIQDCPNQNGTHGYGWSALCIDKCIQTYRELYKERTE